MDQWNHSFHLISFAYYLTSSRFISPLFYIISLFYLTFYLTSSHSSPWNLPLHLKPLKPLISSSVFSTWIIWTSGHSTSGSQPKKVPRQDVQPQGHPSWRALGLGRSSMLFCWCSSLAWKKMITTNKRILGLKSCETNWMASFAPTLRGYIISTNICCIFVWLSS